MKYCPYCGTGLGEDMRFCPKCGKPYADGQTNPHVSGKHIKEVPHTDESNTVAYAVPKKKKRGIFSTLVVVLLLAALTGGLYFGGVFSPKKELKLPFSDDPATIAKASESVVMLNCYDKNGELYATGSGFAIFEDGVIVTNYHVIEGEVWRIAAETETGLSFEYPTVLAYDEDKDLAVLKAKGQPGLTLLTPGSSAALQKGEKLVAVGSPLGLMNSVSTGVFSGSVDDETGRLLQFTAAISHGSSGGALFNDAGEVVGVTFASLEDGQSINFAVPIEDAKALYESHSAAMSIETFYDSFDHAPPIPTYTVGYVLEHYEELDGQEMYVEGYVSSVDNIELYMVDSAQNVLGREVTKDNSKLDDPIYTQLLNIALTGLRDQESLRQQNYECARIPLNNLSVDVKPGNKISVHCQFELHKADVEGNQLIGGERLHFVLYECTLLN